VTIDVRNKLERLPSLICLTLRPDSIAKLLQLEKSLYDGGASPQDVAMVISMAAKSGSIDPVTPGAKALRNLHDAHACWLSGGLPSQKAPVGGGLSSQKAPAL
jgi:hypothetical protein